MHAIRNTSLAIAAALSVLTLGTVVTSPAAQAATNTTTVIAADTTTVVAASTPAPKPGPRIAITAPREISVVGHGGKPVTLSSKGVATKVVPRPGKSPATFTGLVAGKSYVVRVAGKAIGTAVAIDRPKPATNLSVRTTDSPTSVAISWNQVATTATGGNSIIYTVAGTSPTAPTVTAKVTRDRVATLAGLDSSALYTFSVTPSNAAGSGGATKASMTRSLASITGQSPDKGTIATAPDPTPTPTPTPKATPASSTPAPAPAPAPSGPRTTTIYVCPDGFASIGDQCQQTRQYTFHTETVAYTYHWGVVGSHIVHHASTDPCNYLPNPNSPSGLDIYCPPGWDETVYDYGNVKDATPSGYTDTGSAWTHEVKDTAPAGYVDDGSQWVKTVAKEARTITV